jgi:hypothetical protein
MGRIKDYKYISFPTKSGTELKALIKCPDCLKQRWVRKRDVKQETWTKKCRSCSSRANGNKSLFINKETNPNYNGGIVSNIHGYRAIKLEKDHPFYIMANKNGYVLEHRFVMACQLNRPLKIYELVHHRNGNKQDNRTENLEVVSPLLNQAYYLYERETRNN